MTMKTFVILLAAAAAVSVARPAAAADVQRGARLYANWCGYCHDPVSERQPQLAGTYTLQQRYKGEKPAALVERTDLTPDFVKTIVRQGLNVMPAFRKTEVSDAELDDIAAFLAHAR
jgi:mono/diheme cytochrome c family protein